ncbi:MAG: hypothetical protein CMC84_04140 [Flavobacteriaceae bacterium]|nr:hypothetical protein [Flavobacteriaceae bacterium]
MLKLQSNNFLFQCFVIYNVRSKIKLIELVKPEFCVQNIFQLYKKSNLGKKKYFLQRKTIKNAEKVNKLLFN